MRDGDGAGTGYSFWAYDENLKLRWRADAHGAWHGMYMWFCDVDGDGRDVLPGYELYDGDGNKLWTMEGAEYIEDSGGAGHIDHAAFGELDGDPSNGPEIGIAGSDPGFFPGRRARRSALAPPLFHGPRRSSPVARGSVRGTSSPAPLGARRRGLRPRWGLTARRHRRSRPESRSVSNVLGNGKERL